MIATETRTCESCGTDFERERKRGRPPKRCPDCRSKGKRRKAPSVAEGDVLSWWCDGRAFHKVCAEFGVGKGIPCNCECHGGK